MTLPVETYRVAAIQFEPVLGAKAENIARLLTLVESAAQLGARLIVLPEMATTGYCWYSRDEVRPHVEPIPGPTTDVFAELAQHYDCYIVIGMPEVAPHSGIFYNSAALVGPEGVLGVYRKTHSYVSELKWAKDGDRGLPVWNTPLGRIGIMICMDAGYFEPARLLALAGADVLCFPTNWLGEKSPSPAWSVRAFENGCYLIGANRYGCERGIQFSGGSCVLNPDGSVQASQDTGDGIVYGEVSLAAARMKSFVVEGLSEKLTARRPELYDSMTLNSYLWEPMELHELYGYRPLPAGRRSQVAVVQFRPRPGNPAENIAQIEHTLVRLRESANGEAVDLVIFPEYTLTGNPINQLDVAISSADLPVFQERLIEIAQRHALHLVVGFAERSDDSIYSSVVAIAPQGLLASYRKTHVVGEERLWLCAGSDKPPIIDVPLGRIGIVIGTDLCFPEITRQLAIEGCDLIVVAASGGLPPVRAGAATAVPLPPPAMVAEDPSHIHLARQRAVENNSYVAFACFPAPDGVGWSGVFGPDRDGETVIDASATGAAIGVIDTTHINTPYPALAVVRSKMLLGMRQTHLYEPLHLHGTHQQVDTRRD